VSDLPAGASTRPKRADARRNHDRIVTAARDAFATHGADAPLDDIARNAGVGPGTLYRHFPTRAALVEAVYREHIGGMADLARELAERFPPGEALERWMHEQVDSMRLHRGLGTALKSALDRTSETFTWCQATIRAAASALVEAAQAAGNIRTDVTGLEVLRLTHGIAMASEYAPEGADRLLQITIDGLRPRPEPVNRDR
jgi:AcrR family transcriptional regulator